MEKSKALSVSIIVLSVIIVTLLMRFEFVDIDHNELRAQSVKSIFVFQDSLAFSATIDSTTLHSREFSYTLWPIGGDMLLKVLPRRDDLITRPARYVKIQDGASITIDGTQANKLWFAAETGVSGTLYILGLRTKTSSD
jgi:hypothetical protein